MTTTPPENHLSYKKHRRQVWTQIFTPIFLTLMLVVGVAVLAGKATFAEGLDPTRWTAISIIWLVLPILAIGLVVLIILTSLTYMLAEVLHYIPPQTFKAQNFIYKVAEITQRFTNMAAKPFQFVEDVSTKLKGFFQRWL